MRGTKRISTGKIAKNPMSRGPNHRPNRDQRFAANRAKTKPITQKNSMLDNGASQMKCRLSPYIFMDAKYVVPTMRAATSSRPLASPHHADSTRMSSGRSRGSNLPTGADMVAEKCGSAAVIVLTRHALGMRILGLIKAALIIAAADPFQPDPRSAPHTDRARNTPDLRTPSPNFPVLSPIVAGTVYSHTACRSTVTSNIVPVIPSQTSVFPLGSRWAPDMNAAKKSCFLCAVNRQAGSFGP